MTNERKEEILAELRQDLHEGVTAVVNGELDNYSNRFLWPGFVEDYLTENGAIDLEQRESNGWEYDNWAKFKIAGKNYVVQGSGFYGGIGFYLDNVDELIEESDDDIENIKPWE